MLTLALPWIMDQENPKTVDDALKSLAILVVAMRGGRRCIGADVRHRFAGRAPAAMVAATASSATTAVR
jgi:hypothetical protein